MINDQTHVQCSIGWPHEAIANLPSQGKGTLLALNIFVVLSK